MKLLLLSFYFQPDLCAGSFRCTALVNQLRQVDGLQIDVITTLPNRYASYSSEAKEFEQADNVSVYRVPLPTHKSGMVDQAKAFYSYYKHAKKIAMQSDYDAVFATSSRLFTAFLGSRLSRKLKIPLYLDIRDIFVDTIKDVLPGYIAKVATPFFTRLERYTFRQATSINLVSRGFEDYFSKHYRDKRFTWFTNGVDDDFISEDQANLQSAQKDSEVKTVLYAGNIGEGQGLHNILPQLAAQLNSKVNIKVLGDGGRKEALASSLELDGIENVELQPPVNRVELMKEYNNADVLFLHLNDYPAFKKVLPSKIFEYAATGKPVLAGVCGYPAKFLEEEVHNSAVFPPGDAVAASEAFESLKNGLTDRSEFVERYKRTNIMGEMRDDIVQTVLNGSCYS